VEKTDRNLDKLLSMVVKYIGKLNIAMNGKSTVISNHQRVWVTGCKPGQECGGKVRPGARKSDPKVINESGTAAQSRLLCQILV